MKPPVLETAPRSAQTQIEQKIGTLAKQDSVKSDRKSSKHGKSSRTKKSKNSSGGKEPSSLHHVKESGVSDSSSSSDLSSSVYSSTISSHLTGDEEQEKHHIKDLVGGEEDEEEAKSVQYNRYSITEAIPEQSDEHSSKAGTEPRKKVVVRADRAKSQ